MGDILPFKKKPTPKRSTLCANNHHKWKVSKSSRFDVKKGKLLTIDVCERCGKQRQRYS